MRPLAREGEMYIFATKDGAIYEAPRARGGNLHKKKS